MDMVPSYSQWHVSRLLKCPALGKGHNRILKEKSPLSLNSLTEILQKKNSVDL